MGLDIFRKEDLNIASNRNYINVLKSDIIAQNQHKNGIRLRKLRNAVFDINILALKTKYSYSA